MDKVRFQSQERLDKVDADALQELVYGYMGEALGGLMGNAGGALTTIEYTVSEAGGSYYLNLGPFQWYHSQPDGVTSITEFDGTTKSVPKRFQGQVVTFNPADEGQSELVDWTVSRALFESSATVAEQQETGKTGVMGAPKVGGAIHSPILWARPASIDTDTDARREWSVAAGDEVPISIKTRTRTISELRFRTNRPVIPASDTNQNQWVPIARTIAWDFSGGTTNAAGAAVASSPYLVPLYVWDHVASYGDYEQQNANEGSVQGSVGTGTARYAGDDGSVSSFSTDGSTFHEIPPFEHDGAGISHLARGRWLPAGGVATPGVGNPTSAPTTHGADAQGVSYPYLGWYDDSGYVVGSDGTDYSGKGWKPLSDSGYLEAVAPWRLGIPQTLYLMRRVMASMQSSGGNRPWWVLPEGGGLVELRQRIDTVSAGYVSADTEQVGSPTGSTLDIVASGRVSQDYAGSTKTFSGAGSLVKVTEGLTSSGNYSVWQVPGTHTVSSVLLGNLAHGDNTAGTAGFGLTHPGAAGGIGGSGAPLPLIGWTWVTRGDLAGANLTTQFTLWTSSYESGYMGPASVSTSQERIYLGLAFQVPSNTGYRLYTEGQQTAPAYTYYPPTTTSTTFNADFRMGVYWNRPWDQNQSVQQTYVTVIGEAV